MRKVLAFLLFFTVNAYGDISGDTLSVQVQKNSQAINEMSKVMYLMAKKIKEIEKENADLKRELEELKRSGNSSNENSRQVKKPVKGKVLRIVSVFRGTKIAPVWKGLNYLEEKTGVPLYAGLGTRYFVVFTKVPVSREILKKAGFGDAYWETDNKPIYQFIRPLKSADDVLSLYAEYSGSGSDSGRR